MRGIVAPLCAVHCVCVCGVQRQRVIGILREVKNKVRNERAHTEGQTGGTGQRSRTAAELRATVTTRLECTLAARASCVVLISIVCSLLCFSGSVVPL